ncbi:MAG: sulfotransferase [Planctomycetaceae bacterium]|nr:sulfotransferase [Planctomycetaceae bacterium]
MADSKPFLLRHFGPGCLAGISLRDWLALLAENRFHVSPAYLGKAAYISVSSVLTSLFSVAEQGLISRQLAKHQCSAPVFILGCWRSGTTYLHNLLSVDERFISPSLFQTMYPHTCLTNEWWLRPSLEFFVPQRRFMDNMTMGLREPAEDEMALAILTLRSNMLSWVFRRNSACYDRFLDFTEATSADRELWKRHLRTFVNKVTLGNNRRPLLKSPNHTARVQLLLELYPDARFLHIRRHPFDVYRSLVHMATQVTPVWGLQHYPPELIPEMVIETYKRLYHAYFSQIPLIPPGQFHDLAYEDLVASPIDQLESAYSALNLDGFDSIRPALEEYCREKSGYRKNRHHDIPEDVCARLKAEWQQSFAAWGYE